MRSVTVGCQIVDLAFQWERNCATWMIQEWAYILVGIIKHCPTILHFSEIQGWKNIHIVITDQFKKFSVRDVWKAIWMSDCCNKRKEIKILEGPCTWKVYLSVAFVSYPLLNLKSILLTYILDKLKWFISALCQPTW